jgi:hypothetical protein
MLRSSQATSIRAGGVNAAGAALATAASYEESRAAPRLHQAAGHQAVVGLDHGEAADARLFGHLADRRQAGAGPQALFIDAARQPIGQLRHQGGVGLAHGLPRHGGGRGGSNCHGDFTRPVIKVICKSVPVLYRQLCVE